MAEVLGIVASAVGVIQLASQVAAVGWGYIAAVKGASKTIQDLLSEISCLVHVLTAVRDYAEKNPGQAVTLEMLSAQLQKCDAELRGVRKKLEQKGGLKGIIDSLKWPLKEPEMLQHISRIERHKNLFNFALTVDNITISKAIREGVDKVFVTMQGIGKSSQSTAFAVQSLQTEFVTQQQQYDVQLKDEKHKQALEWLYSSNFNARHEEINEKRQKNTGQWLPETPEMKGWAEGKGCRLLWGRGIPGAGKTFLSSVVINKFESGARAARRGVAHIYFSYADQENQRATQVLRCLIRQLANLIPELPEKVSELYESWKRDKKTATTKELYAALLGVSALFTQVFFIFDALDEDHECDEPRRNELLPLFDRMGNDGVFVFLTSRPHPQDIQAALRNVSKIELSAQKGDIETYVQAKIKNSPRAGSLFQNGKYNDMVISGLTECAKGMFLLVRLYTEYLCQKTTTREVLRTLDELRKGSTREEDVVLDLAYERAMEGIRGQSPSSKNLAFKILSWLAKAKRTLTTKELQTAVAVEKGRCEIDELDLVAPEILIDVCASLVTIDGDTIRLAHYTVQEYLLTRCILPATADWDMAMACTTYLSLDTLAQGACIFYDDMENRLGTHPFLDYAAHQLRFHLMTCDEDSSTDMFIYFIENSGNISSWLQYLSWSQSWSYRKEWQNRPNKPPKQIAVLPLHIASDFGHLAAVRILLEDGANASVQDGDGNTALHWAARGGHEPIVGLLLDKGADIAARNILGDTAFLCAAKGGNKAVVELLLNQGACIAAQNEDGYTALLYATERGHESVVRLLLDKGADIAGQSKNGDTALLCAAEGGYETVVRLLLDNGADIEAQNVYGYTALLCAAEEGHEVVVRLLLDKRADIAAQNKNGNTALLCAAEEGHEPVVRLLLDKGADISIRNKNGDTALLGAVKGGNEKVVGLLLSKGADIAAQNRNGDTALFYAAEEGHEPIVELLLDKGVDIAAQNKNRDTALLYAAKGGHNEVVGLLLDNRADITAQNMYGYTALLYAAERGHELVLRLLLDKGADIDDQNQNGDTALLFAARKGNEAVIELLLGKGANIAAQNENSYTALLYAANGGHKPVVELLLNNGADIEAQNVYGYTALLCAAKEGHETVVRLLLDKRADIEARNKNGYTALLCAAKGGHKAVLGLLLEKGADTAVQNEDGYTALLYAAKRGNKPVVELLLDNGIDIAAQSKGGDTALLCATKRGNKPVVELLLEKGVDIAARNKSGDTALLSAVKGGNEAVVELLLDKGAEIAAQNEDGYTALLYAAERGNETLVGLLLEKGADISSQGKYGDTALHHAVLRRRGNFLLFLLDKRADPSVLNSKGQTALDLAFELGHRSEASILLQREYTSTQSKNESENPLPATPSDDFRLQALEEIAAFNTTAKVDIHYSQKQQESSSVTGPDPALTSILPIENLTAVLEIPQQKNEQPSSGMEENDCPRWGLRIWVVCMKDSVFQAFLLGCLLGYFRIFFIIIPFMV